MRKRASASRPHRARCEAPLSALLPDLIPTARAVELYPKGTAPLADMKGLARVVEELFRAAPKARLAFSQMSDSLFDDLAAGILDCAVYPATRELPPGLKNLLLYPISYAVCVRKGHPLVELSRERGEVNAADLRCWRKISVTNRAQNKVEIYCMDESTVLGEALQETAVTVPYFLAVPTLLCATDFTAVMPMQTARLFEERHNVVAIPIHPDPENARGRDEFHTRLIWHERVDGDPALQWLRSLFAAYARWSDPRAAAAQPPR